MMRFDMTIFIVDPFTLLSFPAFNEMDENHDGQVSEEEFIEVLVRLFSMCPFFHLSHVQACMSQKKFSTMLTLKIIDVFVSSE